MEEEKMKKHWLLVFLLFFVFFGLTACKDPGTEEPVVEPKEAASVSLNYSEKTLYVGEELQLQATVLPADAEDKSLTWESDHSEIATVSNSGLVTALAAGDAVITAKTVNNKSASMTVHVIEEPVLEEGYYFDFDFDSDILPRNLSLTSGGGGAAVVEDGVLHMETVGTGQTMGNIAFSEALQGTVVAETKVKVGTTAFSNILFFYTNGSALTDVVACLGFDAGSIKYHDGSGWKNLTSYSLNTWYEIRMVLNIGERVGESDKGYFDLFINGTKFEGIPFRNGGDGVEDNILRLEFGTSKANADITYDYLLVYESEKPTLLVSENSGVVDLETDPTFTFAYTVTGKPTPQVTITADKETGYTLADNVATFTASGLYNFTITATNGSGTVSETVVIQVLGNVAAPQLEIVESGAVLILKEENSYQLKYNVLAGNPEPEIQITCDKDEGLTISGDDVVFTQPGEYLFTVTASNTGGSVSKTIQVVVLDSHELLDIDFDGSEDLPEGVSVAASGTGNYVIGQADGAVGNALHITTDATGGAVDVTIPFPAKLSGKVVVETRVKVGSTAFSNVLFFYTKNSRSTADIALSLAFENGYIRNHQSGGWKNTNIAYELNTWYDLTVVVDIERAVYTLYLNGENMGEFAFRNPDLRYDITHFIIGTGKANTDLYYDFIRMGFGALPKIEMEESEATLELDTNATYNLDYQVAYGYPHASVTITCNKDLGFTIEDDVITFTAAGVYEFTVTCENIMGSVSKKITITVLGSVEAPDITVENDTVYYDINSGEPLTLSYQVTGNPEPEVALTCDKESGFALDGNTVTFTEAGTYVFTITASNQAATVTARITVIVDAHTMPEIEFEEETASVDLLQYRNYSLKYTVSGTPDPEVRITVDQEDGYLLDGNDVRFFMPGIYTFTVTATNIKGTISEQIVVYVEGPELEYLLDVDFNSDTELPEDYTVKTTGEGKVEVKSGVSGADGNVLSITTGPLTDEAQIAIPFGRKLEGKVVVEARVMVGSTAFANVLFFYANNGFQTSDIALSLAFEGGTIRNHFNGWNNTNIPYELNTWNDLRLVLDIEKANYELYFNGEYCNTFSFRNASLKNDITHFYIGTGKANTKLYYDEIKVYNVPQVKVAPENEEVILEFGETNPTYELQFEVLGQVDEPTITCDQEDGFILEGKQVTFTAPGTYVFTIRAGNKDLIDEATITVTVSESVPPTIVTEENEFTHDIELGEFTLEYTVTGNPLPEVAITCDQETGYTLSENKVTFTAAGTYVFTITATNSLGSDEVTITVVAVQYVAPEITLPEEAAEVDLTVAPNYTLEYQVTGVPEAEVTITCDQENGYVMMNYEIGFTLPGVYTFTITAENQKGTAQKTLEITVYASKVENYIFNNDFDSVPEGMTVDGGGSVASNEGILECVTVERGRVLYNVNLTEKLSGTIVYETRVKVSIESFINVLFLYADSTNVLGVAFEGFAVKYQNGKTWAASGATYELNEWVTVRAVLKLGSGKFDLYVNGIPYKDLSLRNPGSYEANINAIKNIGIDNRTGIEAYFDYQRIYCLDPVVEVEESAATVSLTVNPEYSFKYSFKSALPATVEITSEQTEGFVLDGNTVTFTEAGTYVFNITAKNKYASVTKTVTVVVGAGTQEPEITVLEDSGTVDLAGISHDYELKYTLNDAVPAGTLTVTCDQSSGWTIDGNIVSFTEIGTYRFTLTYANELANDEKVITVEVVKSEPECLLDFDFADTEIPDEISTTTTGSGSIKIESGVAGASENVLHLATGATTGSAFAEIVFPELLSGTVITEARIMVGSTAFSNVLFYYNTNGATIVNCVAFEGGSVKYHSGSWKTTGFNYAVNTWYTVKLVMHIDDANFDLFIDNVLIGNFSFRTPASNHDIYKFRNGSDKVNSDIYYDYLKVYNYQAD